MAFIAEVLGSISDFGSANLNCHNCPFCLVSTKDLHLLPSRNYAGAEVRTLQSQTWMAHLPLADALAHRSHLPTFPFTCPACSAVFNSAEVN